MLVMGQTPFYQTPNKLEHHLSNIKRTQTYSCIGDRTRTPYFWLQTIEHQFWNLIELLNYSYLNSSQGSDFIVGI